ncbi:MAG TPA: DUF4097 family beta strand repeat-containing protein, partial [Kineosporiaceae bacterium]|nr:DUF4097 family beta strand repeat-containing protein [Kineosporiaceae bacterium]
PEHPAGYPSGYPHGYPPDYPTAQGHYRPVPPRNPNPVLAGSLRVLGLVVVLGLLGAGAAAVVVEFFRQQAIETAPLAIGVTQVFATTDTGDVRVRAAAVGEQPRMIRTLHWSFERPQLQQAVSAGIARVDARCPRQWFMSNCSVDLELVVPAATAMQVETDTGRISVSGTSGGLTAITSTGAVTLSGVSGGSVSARTNTGDVTVLATGADGVLAASTDTGDVRLSFTTSPRSVRASTSTGDVTISVPQGDSYAVNTRTDVGESTVLVPNDPAAPRSISATTSVGDIQVATAGR